MTRWLGRVGAACTCLFLFAGCTLDSFSLNAFGTAKGDGPVVAGSLDVVSASAQKALSDMHLFVTVHKNSDVVKLAARTPAGKDFVLVLKARKTDHGDETQVSVQWKGDADDAFWVQLAGAIVNPTPTPPDPWGGNEHTVMPDHYVPTEGPPR